jgi:transposase InsO family protein
MPILRKCATDWQRRRLDQGMTAELADWLNEQGMFHTMAAADMTATLDLALQAFGLDRLPVDQPPRLLSDNGPSYVAAELADWLNEQGMSHTRAKPYHPMTQGKIERWHLSLKSRIVKKSRR